LNKFSILFDFLFQTGLRRIFCHCHNAGQHGRGGVLHQVHGRHQAGPLPGDDWIQFTNI